ncbi:MAG TPA: bifunctional adenosylcobinamide kinase/adenosylcobinamide-phosphate guanylyltransferase, partial [Gemmatimonadaceae bacterium]|nr:bifunctional adenosylcobinamide kinase/adenosylcobinamide-phosphate guanylyltransferase [Gemmatimonadaceae bacterium]
ATAQAFDDEMATRIAVHRQERPETWETLESPLHVATDLDRAIAATTEPYATIVIDCVTLWVSNLLMSLEDHDDAEAIVGARVRQLLEVHSTARRAPRVPSSDTAEEVYPTQWIIVSNEVGLGIVPPTQLGRAYRDALGRANQLLAEAADEVTLMVAGLELPLKRSQRDPTGR